MRRSLLSAILSIAVLLCITIDAAFAQASLQEIARFDIPFGRWFITFVDAGGDLNGDGRPDLVFSCISDASDVTTQTYIYYSIPDSSAVPDQIYNAPDPIGGISTGGAIAYAGDLNGDGIADLVTGFYGGGHVHEGIVTISFGGNPPFTTPDVVINPAGLGYTHEWDLCFGTNLITNCDVNGDGINDLLVYAPGPQWENWGNVYVFLGGNPFRTTPAVHIRGAVMEEYLGKNMQTGDINGDGYDDIILTNTVPVNPQNESEGYHYYLKIYPGGETITNVPIYETLLGTSTGISFGKMIANGDLNGDGYDDIIINYGSADGRGAKVFYGHDDLTNLRSVNLELGYTYYTIESYVNLNNDPYSDLWVKLHRPMPNDPYEGSYAVYRQTSEVLDLIPDFIDPSPVPRISYGYCYPLGDMNNDGSPEFFVYAYPTSNPPGPAYATILSESYVSSTNEYIQPARVEINCYPNPFRDRLNIRLTGTAKSDQFKSLEVYNLKGQLVYHKANLHGKKIHWNGLDSHGNKIGSGIYMVKVSDTKGNIHTAKVVSIK